MTQLDPIIAVKDVEASAKWYHQVFRFKNAHGGKDFAVLKSEDDEIILCLHQWEDHNYPSLSQKNIKAGNGLLLYFRTNILEPIRKNIENAKGNIEEEIRLNPNSLHKEFSFRDRDGYYIIVSEIHTYQG